jgi:transcriptional regulator with XRE-family HTH domain
VNFARKRIYMCESVGEKIRGIRRDRKLTQKQLAELTGVSLNTVNRIEQGHRTADAEFLTRLGEALQCDLGQLLGKAEAAGGVAPQGRQGIPVLRSVPEDLGQVAPETVDEWIVFPGAPAGTYAVRVAEHRNITSPR